MAQIPTGPGPESSALLSVLPRQASRSLSQALLNKPRPTKLRGISSWEGGSLLRDAQDMTLKWKKRGDGLSVEMECTVMWNERPERVFCVLHIDFWSLAKGNGSIMGISWRDETIRDIAETSPWISSAKIEAICSVAIWALEDSLEDLEFSACVDGPDLENALALANLTEVPDVEWLLRWNNSRLLICDSSTWQSIASNLGKVSAVFLVAPFAMRKVLVVLNPLLWSETSDIEPSAMIRDAYKGVKPAKARQAQVLSTLEHRRKRIDSKGPSDGRKVVPHPGFEVLGPGKLIDFLSKPGIRILVLWDSRKEYELGSLAYRVLLEAHQSIQDCPPVGFSDVSDWEKGEWEAFEIAWSERVGKPRPTGKRQLQLWYAEAGISCPSCIDLYKDGARLADLVKVIGFPIVSHGLPHFSTILERARKWTGD